MASHGINILIGEFLAVDGEPVMAPTCPYCGAALARMPTRKTKCPACGEPIFVKKLADDRRKHLMTEAQAADSEALWQVYHDDRSVADFCRQWGLDINLLKAEIAARGCTVGTAFESHYRVVLDRAADPHQCKMAAHMLAIIEGKRGGDFLRWRREVARYELLALPRNVFKRVEIRPGFTDGRCQRCVEIAGRVLTIEEAIKTMPLPDPQCDARSFDGRRGFCSCSYSAVIESLHR